MEGLALSLLRRVAEQLLRSEVEPCDLPLLVHHHDGVRSVGQERIDHLSRPAERPRCLSSFDDVAHSGLRVPWGQLTSLALASQAVWRYCEAIAKASNG